jgi:hypothetical protein
MVTRTAKSAASEMHENMQGGVNGSQASAEDEIDAVTERLDAIEEQLRIVGDRLVESAKTLTAAASKQMQLHPLTAFGVAFLAGVTVAKLLRR